ncbi:MAG TPA: hypothetical protein EYN79_00790 [Planctomycetes bacterium]|nr:hypothetical protein [Planctomycetota bacterium]
MATAAVEGNLDAIDPALLAIDAEGAPGPALDALAQTVEALIDLDERVGPHRLEMERAIIERKRSSRKRAQRGWQRAWRAASRGETSLASALIDDALAGPEDLLVDYGPARKIPIDLAVSALLTHLKNTPEGNSIDAERQRRAEGALAIKIGGDQLKGLREIARLHPNTRAGRRARLRAAELLYKFGGLGSSLLELQRLVVREPQTAEAVEARLRIIELLRETGQLTEAREETALLVEEHGDRPLLLTRNGTQLQWTVRDRAEELIAEIESLAERAAPPRIGLPQEQVWRNRIEIGHQRSLHVIPLETKMGAPDQRYLTLSHDSVELRDGSTGILIWRTVLPRNTNRSAEGFLLQRRESLETPLAIDVDAVVVTDRYDLWRLSMVDGSVKWQLSLPPEVFEDGPGTTPVAIERSTSGDGKLILLGNDDVLHAYDIVSGEFLWQVPVPGPLVADPEFFEGKILLGYALPERVEIRSSDDGSLLQQLDFGSSRGPLADGPWFSGGDIIIPFEKGELHRVTSSGDTVWEIPMPHIISRVHRGEGLPWLVVELYWSRERPTLLGISEESGRILWKRTLHSDSRRLQQILPTKSEIYIVDGNFRERHVTCLDVPSGYQQEEVNEELTVAELPIRWTTSLTSGFDIANLRPYRDWLFVEDRFRCQLTLLSRETGDRLLARQGFSAVEDFLEGRRRLFFGGLIGETLCLITARGALGLRPPDPVAREKQIVELLLSIDPASSGSLADPVSDARRLYRSGEVEAAIMTLEEPLEEPRLLPSSRRGLHRILEGLSEEAGDTRFPKLSVPRLSQIPRIDGSLDEPWNASKAIPFRSARHFRAIQGSREDLASWRGWQDLSAILFTGWSDEGFHIALDVHDDRTHPYDGDAPRWRGDCLLLAFDLLGDGGTRAGSDDQLLTLALTVPPPQVPDPEVEEGEEPADGGEAPEEPEDDVEGRFQVKRKSDGSGVIYEGTIPWQTFMDARQQSDLPFPGLEFGLNLVLTDDDNGQGATSYMSTTTGQVLHQDPRRIWDVFIPDRFVRVRIER